MNLSESEEKFLLKLEKNLERVYIVYISVAISLCGAVLCLIMGLVRGREKSLNAALFLAMLGISLFSTMRAYQKMFKIVSKLKKMIKESQ
jgi:predicted membrane channel-forming protein YqfA (hemolysin III family)